MIMLREEKMKDEMKIRMNNIDFYKVINDEIENLSKYPIISGTKNEELQKCASILLLNDEIYLKDHIYSLDGNLYENKVSIFVRCDDIFDDGLDEESVHVYELEDLFRMWAADRLWGTTVWCVKKRRVMPQASYKKDIERKGWDLNAYVKGEENER